MSSGRMAWKGSCVERFFLNKIRIPEYTSVIMSSSKMGYFGEDSGKSSSNIVQYNVIYLLTVGINTLTFFLVTSFN